MKKRFYKIIIFFIAVLFIAGCKTSVNNSFKITNNAAADVIITFRAQTISVPSGQTTEIKEIPQGTYTYTTAYSVPASATSDASSGDVTRQLTIKAGTRYLLLFTSTLRSGTYTLYATLSGSDDESTPTSP